MPEYLSPGVYIEETSYRAKSIQGVATSTAGFVGPCLYGPTKGRPPLVTSFEEFRRTFGGLDALLLGGTPTPNYLAHAVKAFFDNGGQRLYVARTFAPVTGQDPVAKSPVYQTTTSGAFAAGTGASTTPLSPRFIARSPGRAGNFGVRVTGLRSGNLIVASGSTKTLQGVKPGDIVELVTGSSSAPATPKDRKVSADPQHKAAVDISRLRVVRFNDQGQPQLFAATSTTPENLAGVEVAQRVTLTVEVGLRSERVDAYSGLSTHADSPTYIGKVLRAVDPEDRSARVYFSTNPGSEGESPSEFGELLASLIQTGSGTADLTGGSDGAAPSPTEYEGGGVDTEVTGLAALAEVEDIAIVAAPGGSSAFGSDTDQQSVRDKLISHCERLKYRFAILSGDRTLDEGEIRDARGQHDTSYAALYYPWVTVSDPQSRTGELLDLPPEGFIAGIFARSDVERGVHKAPANEVVRGALRFSRSINKGQQDTLNPEGINCLRSFEGRGHRVWGARTLSSDPEWMYVNVRRLFIYLEHSIDKNTQWVVFEPNNESLWLKVRLTIESFLLDVFRSGALMGTKPEEAFFVRCDRSTMTQSDLDNGRLIVLVGVAPTKPAEFVVFRIGQWTADASII
ncbi:phage tail sheath subtilisin-like domain-containing protein [Sorangium sp. So ce1182]|uniref:phage tail sheath subtilisin-like domain-containing protein n=1 Tax=Sorangium sp. So ce1182 TaxID=3133334 RepID=UPI003F644481